MKYRNHNFELVGGVAIDYVDCDTSECTAVLVDGARFPCPNIDRQFAEKAVHDGIWTKDEETT